MTQIGEDYKTQDIKGTHMGDVTNHGIGSQFNPSTAKKSKDGFWRDNNNNLPKDKDPLENSQKQLVLTQQLEDLFQAL